MREMIFDGEDLIRLDSPIPRWVAFSNDNYVLGLEVNLPQFVTLQERKASFTPRKKALKWVLYNATTHTSTMGRHFHVQKRRPQPATITSRSQ